MNSRHKTQDFLIILTIFCLPFYFVRLKYSWISFNVVELLILALLAMWFFNKEKKYFIQNTKYLIPTALIFSGLLLSIIVNKNYYVGLGVLKGWFVLPIIFAIILFDRLKKDEKLVNKVWLALFASGVLVSVEGIYYWFFGLVTFDGRLKIFFDSPNQLAMFLAPAFLIGCIKFGKSLALMNCPDLVGTREKPSFEKKVEFWKKSAVIAGILLIAFNLYLTKSYGAWLSIGVASAVVFWLKHNKKTHKKYLAVCAIIFVVLVGWASFNKFKNIQSLGDRSSLDSRVMIWKSAGLMVERNPVFGIGPGNFQNTYLEYQKYFPPYLEWSVPQPHNLFLAFWLEAGLLGLVGFIWLLVVFFQDNKKVYPLTKTDGLPDASAYKTKKQDRESLSGTNNFGDGKSESESHAAWLCLGIILYFLLHGLIDTTYWRNDMAIIFWTVVAINIYLAGKNINKEDKYNF